MIRHLAIFLFLVGALLPTHAEEPAKKITKDTGKEEIGKIKATLYIATNEEITQLTDQTKKSSLVEKSTVKRFQHIEKMRFKHYRKLGEDTQSVFRSYENWLSPLKPSEEILISFESQGQDAKSGIRLDLELWQQHRKVMKSNPILRKGHPLLILGPKWRGGTLIIAVELISLKPQS